MGNKGGYCGQQQQAGGGPSRLPVRGGGPRGTQSGLWEPAGRSPRHGQEWGLPVKVKTENMNTAEKQNKEP